MLTITLTITKFPTVALIDNSATHFSELHAYKSIYHSTSTDKLKAHTKALMVHFWFNYGNVFVFLMTRELTV